MALAIALRTTSQHSMVTVAGDLDCANTVPLQAFLTAEIGACDRDMVIDLRQLSFLGAAGLSTFLVARAALAHEGRDFSIMCGQPTIWRVFAITGLLDTLNVYSPGETTGPGRRSAVRAGDQDASSGEVRLPR